MRMIRATLYANNAWATNLSQQHISGVCDNGLFWEACTRNWGFKESLANIFLDRDNRYEIRDILQFISIYFRSVLGEPAY